MVRTHVEKLIDEFQLKKDVSFCYVLHYMDSGFVTYRKSYGDNRPLLDDNDAGYDNDTAYISVYQTEVESWINLLKVGNTNKLLVEFACCHDDELQNARKYPEFWAYDTTFGVTKEQRN